MTDEFEVKVDLPVRFDGYRVYVELGQDWGKPKKVCLEGPERDEWYEPNSSTDGLLRMLAADRKEVERLGQIRHTKFDKFGSAYECKGCGGVFYTKNTAQCCPSCSCTTLS